MRFTQFNFHPDIYSGIGAAGYTVAAAIQKKAIPPILERKDVIGVIENIPGKNMNDQSNLQAE